MIATTFHAPFTVAELSRFEMFEIIHAGGVVFLPDRIIKRVEDIPGWQPTDTIITRIVAETPIPRVEVANAPLWQILIPTVVTRRHWLTRLMEHLQPQLVPGVEVVTMEDDGDRSIGAKRNQMIREATARYVNFFDDDDLPADDYVSRILTVLKMPDAPDVVGFKLRYYEDGKLNGIAVHSYGAKDVPVHLESRGMKRMERLPNHLNPVRREIAQHLGFRDLNCGEDGDYAKRMAQFRPRPRELFLDWEAYSYFYRSPRTRKGEVTNELRTGGRKR